MKIIQQIRGRTKVFENSFFPYYIKERLKLGDEIRSIESSKQFKKAILDFIRPKENSIYAIHDISGLKSLTRLRLNFSHLNVHKFRHNIKDTINPMCSCCFEPETTDHYLLCCKLYTDLRLDLLNDIYTINQSLKNFSEDQLVNFLLFGSENFTLETNGNILRHTIEFLKTTECFNSLLFYEQTKIVFFFVFILTLAICAEIVASVTCLIQVLCPV